MKKNKLNKIQIRNNQIKKAMPEVKKLVSQYSRTVISSCLIRLKDVEKTNKKVIELQKELAKLESKLK